MGAAFNLLEQGGAGGNPFTTHSFAVQKTGAQLDAALHLTAGGLRGGNQSREGQSCLMARAPGADLGAWGMFGHQHPGIQISK